MRSYTEILGQLPRQTSLAKLAAEAQAVGVEAHFDAMCQREVAGKFQLLSEDTPLFIRRRCVYGLAEQDRVVGMLAYLNAGDMATALELIRISPRRRSGPGSRRRGLGAA